MRFLLKRAGRLSSNPFAWNHRAHVLFVDQPRYVGYSTGSGPFVLNSKDAALDMVQFIRGTCGSLFEAEST